MIRYYIWDEALSDQSRLEKIVRKITSTHQWPYKTIEVYNKQHKLFRDMLDKTSYQVFFITLTEAEDGRINGLKLAKTVRKACPYASIILISDCLHLIPTTVHQKIEALDFIDKHASDSRFFDLIESCMIHIMEQLNRPKHEKYFHLETSGQYLELLVADIMFFETALTHHKICLHTREREIEYYGILSEVVDSHPYFIRCHRSYVVNVMAIEYIDSRQRKAFFLNGESCQISRKYVKDLVYYFQEFHKTFE